LRFNPHQTWQLCLHTAVVLLALFRWLQTSLADVYTPAVQMCTVYREALYASGYLGLFPVLQSSLIDKVSLYCERLSNLTP
jgi:hypothetical protein